MNHLTCKFYTSPDTARTIVTTKQLKEIMEETDGIMISCGILFDIYSNKFSEHLHIVKLKQSERWL